MKTLKIVSLSALLLSGVAQATTPCNGFEIKVKNKLADDLLLSTIQLSHADLQPGSIQKIKANGEQLFSVNNSQAKKMVGTMIFHTIKLPTKEVKIKFKLENTGVVCVHNELAAASEYKVDKTRLPGKVDYTISNK